MRRFTLALFFIFTLSKADAYHIIGGEMYYDCLGGNDYSITLKVYRDCSNPQAAPFDDPAHIAIYDATGLLVKTVDVAFPGATAIQPDLSNPCLQVPPNICVEQGIYQFTVNLPGKAGGYDIVYQRCCRNATIVNIINPDNTGATYTAHIPDPAIASCNSSPRFVNYPPIVVCASTPLIFDHSATDPDGDQLVYSLCAPNQGADSYNPQPIPPPPPPYQPVIWSQPYTVNDQIGGNPPLSIDSNTGMLTANPVSLGQYVVGVCVKEYRNGVFISQDVRDFQFNVTTCNPVIIADFNATNSIILGDTMLLCGTMTTSFGNQSYGSTDFHWDFGVAGINSDTSAFENPTYTFPDTGIYRVMLVASPGLQCGDTTYKYIEIREGVTASFSTQNECALEPFQFTDLSTALDGTLSSWNWVFGDGGTSPIQNPFHTYSTGGNYSVTLTAYNSYGCSDEYTQSVTVYPLPVLNAAPDTFICDVDSVQLSSGTGVSYLWQPDYNLSNDSDATPIASPDVTTTYSVTVTDANGCVSSDSVTIQVTDTVIADAGPDTVICEGSLVQLYAQGAVYYRWLPDDYLNHDDIATPVSHPSSSVVYYVDSYIGSCVDEDTVTLTVLPLPDADAGNDTTINQGESVQLNASGGTDYVWSPDVALSDVGIANPLASPLNTIIYTVLVTADDGCSTIDSVTVNVTHLHLIIAPNAFTPNGDGLNDVFNFYTKGIAEITSVKIFDRWGEMVFQSSNNETAWDGTYKNLDCEMETYVYVIDGITYDGDAIQESGPLTLIR